MSRIEETPPPAEEQMRSPAGSLLGLLAFVLLLSAPVGIHAAEPVLVMISDLVRAPQQYMGREVGFDGILVEMGHLNAYGPPASTGRTPIEPGPPLQFVVPNSEGGLKRK